MRPEAYRLVSGTREGRPVVWIVGADARGALFGVGRLLRTLSWGRGSATLDAAVDVETAPRYAIRGHQLGYRHHSNTYDGWTEAQFDQYIREIVLLGGNAVENIPFQDTRVSPLMPMSREAMNRRLSAICKKYDVEYWLWTPADFDLKDSARRSEALQSLDALFADLPRLDAIFLPGGDPGDNAASLVVPYLADIAARLKRRHPSAKVWLSLQHFDRNEIDFLFAWIDRDQPDWLGGTRRRSRQLSDSRDATPAQPALSPPRLPGHHAHGAVPVPGAVVGPGVQLHARPRAGEPAPGVLREGARRARAVHRRLHQLLRRRQRRLQQGVVDAEVVGPGRRRPRHRPRLRAALLRRRRRRTRGRRPPGARTQLGRLARRQRRRRRHAGLVARDGGAPRRSSRRTGAGRCT